MRIARYTTGGDPRFGVVTGELDEHGEVDPDATVVALAGDPLYVGVQLTEEQHRLGDVRLLAPVLPRSKVVGIGRNYAAHAAELGNDVPDEPLMFLKPNTSVVGPGDPVFYPPQSSNVHFEGELAVVIGPLGASQLPRERALEAVFGYTVANDVTARDLQRADGQWTRAKGFDSFCPLGPWIETVLDPADLAVRTEVDGEVRQDSRTSRLVHDVATLISYVSHVMTLLPNDVVLTGTPAGVGPLRAGQTVSVTVEGIGTLTNPVRSR